MTQGDQEHRDAALEETRLTRREDPADDVVRPRIAVAGAQSSTIDFLDGLHRGGLQVDLVLTVGPELAGPIADYQDLGPTAAKHGARCLRVATYAMQDEATKDLLSKERIDVLFVVGWQRLIPGWLLDRIPLGAYGMHGSAERLPRGRGRSPMNWSIIEGRDRFYTNLFRYDEGIDSGAIVDTQRFDITERDTIRSLQHKNTLAQVRLTLRHIDAILQGTAPLRPQPTDVAPTYYPKRTPEDGVIDWRDDVGRIDRLVRAVGAPYPGAFTYDKDVQVMVWAGSPFDTQIRFDGAEPGEIVAAFHDGTFVVKCADATFYVTEWEAPGWRPRSGTRLRSMTNPSWEKLEGMYRDD